MLGISIVTTHGQRVTLPDQQLAELKASFGDRLVTPGSRGYDEARTIWNGMIHRRPALIARCETAAEVQQAVRVAAASNLLVSIKGGGHNIAGNALCHDGLMIDLSPMKRVVVDAAARTARVAAWRHARGARRRDAGARPRRAARHQLHHRRRRPDARRRLRLADPQVRLHGRQPDRGRDHHRRRHVAPRERDREQRSLLGDSRRRRQLRRRHRVHVPAASGRARDPRRPDRASVRRPQGADEALPRVRRQRPGRSHHVAGVPQGAAAAVRPRRVARP